MVQRTQTGLSPISPASVTGVAAPWVRWVGGRYLRSKKNSRFLSFITFLSVLGIGVGVVALIVVLSIMDGFEGELRKRLMSSDLHILIRPTSQVSGYEAGTVPLESFPQAKITVFQQRHPEIFSFWPMVTAEAMLRSGRKVKGVILKGVTEERLGRLKPQITEWAEPKMLVQKQAGQSIRLPGLFVGQELAVEMKLLPGDQVSLISPTETEGPLGNVPRLKRFVIEGIYRSGLADQELHTLFASDVAARAFLRRADTWSQWEVTLTRFEDAESIGNALRAELPGFEVQDWRQLNAHLFASLRLERFAMFVVLIFIVIVASFNIVTTLTLMVFEKTREIAILKTMGARNRDVAGIFLWEGLLIGGVGVGGGMTLGGFICLILSRYQFITMPDVYYDRTLPVTFDWRYYAGVAVSSGIIVLVACLYPSKRAASLNPLAGIRRG